MTSTVTAFTPIPERSDATPGLFNVRFQQLQDNQSAAVADLIGWNKGSVSTTVDFSAGTLSTNTIRAASGNTIRIPNGQSLILRSIDSGGLAYHIEAFGPRNSTSVNSAILAASLASIGRVELGNGPITVTSPILERPGVVVHGSGDGEYSDANSSPTVLTPTSAFTGAAVVLADPVAAGGGFFLSGCGLTDVLIDMNSIATLGVNAVEMRSVSNCANWRNITVINQTAGQYLKISQSTVSGAQVSDGITIYDFYGLGKTTANPPAEPTVLIESANEVTFLGARTKFAGRTSGNTPAAGTIGVLIRSQGSSAVNRVTLDGASITGVDVGVKTSYVSGAQGPRYVRVMNCTFEGYNVGVLFSGDSQHLTQHSWALGNCFISSNTNTGTPSAIVLDWAATNVILADQVSATSGFVVSLTSNSVGNFVLAGQGSTISNQGATNVVMGTGSGGRLILGTRGEAAPGIEIDSSAAGTPVVRFLRNGVEKANVAASSALGTDELLVSVGTFQWRFNPNGYTIFPQYAVLSATYVQDGTVALPSYSMNSESALGLYRSGASTMAQSYGTFNLATGGVRLSMRTLAASAVTASAAKTNVAVDEVVFTIGGASGASFGIMSGGTFYYFNSAGSAKQT